MNCIYQLLNKQTNYRIYFLIISVNSAHSDRSHATVLCIGMIQDKYYHIIPMR